MIDDGYVLVIVLLLPLTAGLVVTQVNPYQALVMRGILGAVVVLVYALFGAADVALTEALVGTMLSVTLYAIAVRSSLRMRLGLLEGATPPATADSSQPSAQLLSALRLPLRKHHLHLELVTYPHPQALHAALMAQEVHGICLPVTSPSPDPDPALASSGSSAPAAGPESLPLYQIQTRVQRLYDILQGHLPPLAQLIYVSPADPSPAQAVPLALGLSDAAEVR